MDNTTCTVINTVKTANGITTIYRKAYKCKFCNFETGSGKRELEDHIRRVHTFEKPFTCDICDFASASKPGFKSMIFPHHFSKNNRFHIRTLISNH